MACVMASHAAHIPTHQAIIDANKQGVQLIVNPPVNNLTTPSAIPKSAPHQRPDSVNEICRLVGQCKCHWP